MCCCYCCSVAKSCPTLRDLTDCSTPGFPVHHHIPLGACSNSRPLSQWWHPIISSSVIPFSSRLQSFPASGSFPMSQFFASGGQSIGVSASASVLPMNIQDWFPLGLSGLISLQSKTVYFLSCCWALIIHSYSSITFLSQSLIITMIPKRWEGRNTADLLWNTDERG